MRKLLAFVVLGLVLIGGAVGVSTFTAQPAHACSNGNC
jgi:hypothetical protein